MFAMKKKLQFLLMVLAVWLTTSALAQDNGGFNVRFSVEGATCYNNGRVLYALTDSLGTVLDSLPPQLSQVRVYSQRSDADSVHFAGWYYTGGTDTLTVNYGTYLVGVEALLADGVGGYTRVDTHTVLTVQTSYQKPTASVVAYSAQLRDTHPGTLSALVCSDIGRVQLRILHGRFPYTVTVTDNTTGDTLRTEVFHDRQYDGDREDRYDFRDFYSIDSLPGGQWAFNVEDGCGYGLPSVVETVHSAQLQNPYYLSQFASSGNFSDSNVVKLELEYKTSVEGLQEMMHQHVSYRLIYDGLMTGAWHPLPYDSTATIRYIVYDTAFNADKYCDLWERDITFEYKVSGCGSSLYSRTFQLLKPNELYFAKDSADFTDSTRMEDGNCVKETFWHRDNYSIRYYKSNLWSDQYMPDYVSYRHDHEFYRYHYTHPLTWVYKDLRTGEVIKRDTVSIITDVSSLTKAYADSVYHVAADSDLVIPVERRLLDGKGCELYVTSDTMRFFHRVSRDAVCWLVDYRDDGGKCCLTPRWVRVYRASDFGGPIDGTVVRLVRSPFHNLYNFEAVYSAADKSWTVVKDSARNTAVIIGGTDGLELLVSDYCLPSGPYEFEVETSCGTVHALVHAAFGDFMEMQVSEDIECEVERDCSNLYVRYPSGSFRWMRTNTSSETGLPLDTVYQGLSMKATVVAAPIASIIGREDYYQPSFTFSVPGTYVLRICPNLAVDECSSYACYYDTFHLDAATVEFEEAYAVLCDTSSTEGSAWVRASNGMLPYTFTLFDQPDKQGNILAVNNTGVFPVVPMRSNQTLSCLVQDSCKAYFHVNFQPRAMAELQKLWFEGGLTATTACEGSTIQIHALAVGDIWQYEWSGPGGFHSTSSDPYVFVPRNNGDGWYKVCIRQTGCAGELCDSIYLTVLSAPTLSLSPDTMVCPDEEVEVRFTPNSEKVSGNISFSVAYVNADGVSVRHYSAPSGVTVTDTFATLSPATIYPVSVDDGRCDYLHADSEDTVFIRLRTDVSNVCDLITVYDTVCCGGDARLLAMTADTVPYILRWFGDENQTRLLMVDTMRGEGGWSRYDTTGILQRTLLFVSLQREGECPSLNGLIDSTMSICDGEKVPGVVVADVWKRRSVFYRDEVCQSQTLGYDDPYGMAPEVVDSTDLALAVRKAGNYYFSKTLTSSDGHGCDSTVNFVLTVNPPSENETVATVTQQSGYLWHDSLYAESGRYAVSFTDSVGCDHLDVLHLTVIDVNVPDGEVCRGDSVALSLSASLSATFRQDSLLPRRARPGDVLCTDGSVLSADSFLISGKTPMGVVFHVDESGFHGLAAALTEAQRKFPIPDELRMLIQHLFSSSEVYDMNGQTNTLNLKSIIGTFSEADFNPDVSAAGYCYYFNPATLVSDDENHGWFLPSDGELNILYSNILDVNQTMRKLCSINSAYKSFDAFYYWSSTINSNNKAMMYSAFGWYADEYGGTCAVRPVTKF